MEAHADNARILTRCRTADIAYKDIPKNGTKAILRWMAAVDGMVVDFGGRYKNDERKHRGRKFLKARAGDGVLEKCFVFTMVRNPFARAVSGWLHQTVLNEKHKCGRTFRGFLEAVLGWRGTLHPAYCPQHLFFPPEIAFDFVGTVERFRECFEFICDRTGAPMPNTEMYSTLRYADSWPSGQWTADWPADRFDPDAFPPAWAFYPPDIRPLANEVFAKDCERFGYSPLEEI